MASDLYEEDIVLWAEQQAERLRARIGGDNELDYENLAEEIDTVGRTEARGAESLTEVILAHLLKIEFIGPAETVNHWKVEVKAARRGLAKYLSPTLNKRIPERLQDIYADALGEVTDNYEPDPPLPEACPYSWAEVRDRDWFPVSRFH
jgi:hypothetical protein